MPCASVCHVVVVGEEKGQRGFDREWFVLVGDGTCSISSPPTPSLERHSRRVCRFGQEQRVGRKGGFEVRNLGIHIHPRHALLGWRTGRCGCLWLVSTVAMASWVVVAKRGPDARCGGGGGGWWWSGAFFVRGSSVPCMPAIAGQGWFWREGFIFSKNGFVQQARTGCLGES